LITLTVVDDPIALQSVRETLLRLDPGGNHRTAGTGDEALRLFAQTPPDVVFLEIEMPDMNAWKRRNR
jgi:CheY-like chemotaxis protein